MKTRLLTIGMSLLCGIGVPGAQTPQPAPRHSLLLHRKSSGHRENIPLGKPSRRRASLRSGAAHSTAGTKFGRSTTRWRSWSCSTASR